MRPDDPLPLSPAERLRELARLLARGLLRLASRRIPATVPAPCSDAEKASESEQVCLEVVRDPRLSVHNG